MFKGREKFEIDSVVGKETEFKGSLPYYNRQREGECRIKQTMSSNPLKREGRDNKE